MSETRRPNARRSWFPALRVLALTATPVLTGAPALAQALALALSQAQIDALTHDASAKLAFTTKLQGRWSCAGSAVDGHALKASMLLFHVKPDVYEFELTPTPASPKWTNIIETWQWIWSYGTHGRWFADPDARTSAAGTRFVTDGWTGSLLTWKEYVSPSTLTRTFALASGGGLTFSEKDSGAPDAAGRNYHLTCARSPAH
jgi:hypothetical protein